MTLLTDPSLVEIAGAQYILSHGDSLCTADVGYQLFRTWVRKPWIQKLFLHLPLTWRCSVAKHLRNQSHLQYQSAKQDHGSNMKTNVTAEGCVAVLSAHNCTRLIHGHTHLPAHHQENLRNQEWQRWVLSDWDLDHPEAVLPRASALSIDQHGVRYLDLIKA